MTKFITGEELENAVYNIIWEAEKKLLIVSPYIKLDDYFKRLFDKHSNNPKIHIIIVFGKNEGAISKSLSVADFEYFKKFLNISVVYAPKLHAKYYGNELKGVITSINLYDYSFKHNIEFGVFSEMNPLSAISTSADKEAWNTCMQIAEEHEIVFAKRPVYDKKLFNKNFIKSDILHDVTENFYSGISVRKRSGALKKLGDFPDELELGTSNQTARPTRDEVETTQGFCIRTGVPIPFNPKRPFIENAFRSWAQFGNLDYREKFCHKTGRPSEGKTSMRNPILK